MAVDQERQDREKDGEVIKSGVEFLVYIGVIFIIIGVIGFIAALVSFDWETYNQLKDTRGVFGEDEAGTGIMKSDLVNTISLASASLLISIAIGVFFIAFEKVAFTLKKIQLGIKDDYTKEVGKE